jgi:hypothetical protein
MWCIWERGRSFGMRSGVGWREIARDALIGVGDCECVRVVAGG